MPSRSSSGGPKIEFTMRIFSGEVYKLTWISWDESVTEKDKDRLTVGPYITKHVLINGSRDRSKRNSCKSCKRNSIESIIPIICSIEKNVRHTATQEPFQTEPNSSLNLSFIKFHFVVQLEWYFLHDSWSMFPSRTKHVVEAQQFNATLQGYESLQNALL